MSSFINSFLDAFSPVTLLLSFAVGGLLCVIAQLFIDLTPLTPARILVATVCIGVFLGAVGIYDKLFELCGCGVSVPLIGFGGNIARGVREAIDKEGALGILKGSFTASAAGCTAALLFGYISALIFRGKPKRM